jgi:hypothetical protein
MTEKKHWREAMNERNQDWIKNRDKPREIVTKVSTKKYRDNWDRIFGNRKESKDES